MSDAKISQLPVATTPLAGTELVPIVQSSTTKQTTVDAVLTAGRPVAASTLSTTGNTTLGDASTDTVQVNGYMGVGGAENASFGVYIRNTALTGTGQTGVYSSIVSTSAATSSANAFLSDPRTEAASYTVTNVRGFVAADATKGAGSTITNLHGVYIADQTQGTNNYGITSLVSSGANKWNIYASGTAANYFAGNVGIGSATLVSGTAVSITASGGSVASFGFVNTQASGKTWLMGPGVGTGAAADFGLYNNTDAQRVIGITGGASGNVKLFQNGLERFSTYATEAVFNDPGNDYDFRVESGTNTHALFVQGSDGNVGIGTSSPATRLTISRFVTTTGLGNGGILELVNTNGAAFDQRAEILFRNAGQVTSAISSSYTSFSNPEYAGDLILATKNTTDASVVERLRITRAGNVGIGTSSPGERLSVAGSAQFTDGSPNIYCLGTTGRILITANASGSAASGGGIALRSVSASTNASGLELFAGGAERMRIDSSGNLGLGGSATRATTVGTAALNIFNGTAPVGTLTNGISIYSSSGEAYVMDAAGNATLFSPHDANTNEWIFKSKHTPTGKVLKIDVERLLRFVNDHFGLDAVQEFIEE